MRLLIRRVEKLQHYSWPHPDWVLRWRGKAGRQHLLPLDPDAGLGPQPSGQGFGKDLRHKKELRQAHRDGHCIRSTCEMYQNIGGTNGVDGISDGKLVLVYSWMTIYFPK